MADVFEKGFSRPLVIDAVAQRQLLAKQDARPVFAIGGVEAVRRGEELIEARVDCGVV